MTTSLSPARALPARRLLDLTRYYAAEARSGRLGPIGWGDATRVDDPAARWHVRVHSDDAVDVWLISWWPRQGTELHDHGGSSGAFTVLRGELTEAVWSPHAGAGAGTLVDRVHRAGTGVAFGPRRIHDVRNLGAEPAVSVHAYSTPLRRMNYYALHGATVQPTRTLDTSDPEPVA